MKKVSIKKLKDWIKDEKKGAKEYRKYGFHQLARDEECHARFLQKVLKQKTHGGVF